jgi:hypothetical protein
MMMKLRNVLLACAFGAGLLGAALPAAAQVYGGVYIQTAPPAPIYETVPVAPGPGTATAMSGLAVTMRTGRTPARRGTRGTG